MIMIQRKIMAIRKKGKNLLLRDVLIVRLISVQKLKTYRNSF